MNYFNRLYARLKKVRGNMDGVISGNLVGWAQPLDTHTKELTVGLYARGALLAQVPANIYRGDLEAAGIGDGHFGFAIPLGETLLDLIAANGGVANLCIQTPAPILIGRWKATETRDGIHASALPGGSTELDRLVYGCGQRLNELLQSADPDTRGPQNLPPVHSKLFAATNYINPSSSLPDPMFSYAEYIRYRDRLDEQFFVDDVPEDIAHFFKRYLGVYSAMRGGLRIPLSKSSLDYLNAPITIPGQKVSFSRAMWAFLAETPNIMRGSNFGDSDWIEFVFYWWAIAQSKAIHCEDCLVTDDMAEFLRHVPTAIQGQTFAPSTFMVRFAKETPALATLDLSREYARRDLGCAFLLLAITRPDYLRYAPADLVDSLLDGRAGPSALQDFCKRVGVETDDLTKEKFAAVMHHQNFDLTAMRFKTFTAEGHRLEFAALPSIPAQEVPVDVQVIGPFRKASGLGQATRLSAEMLELSGVEISKVDFGLDNPAPEGFSRAESVRDYQQAKVNLIHLNAEAIPLTYAYQPDVFTGAYNIGYFFWELDSPGASHFLGMEMLDEIWVSTEFGVSVFQPHTDKPVVNVGMSYEALPEIDREDARGFLRTTAGLKDSDFAFLVTFDSFSFVQRKNPLGVLEAFQSAFPKGDPANGGARLVIKTQNRTKIADPHQIDIWTKVDEIICGDSRIVLLNETLAYEDLLRLKKGADAYLSLHRSEGWGFGMIEAMNLKVPVVCTLYSGNVDFCPEGTCWPVDYELVELRPNDYIFVRDGQQWAEPDIAGAATQMRALYNNPDEARNRAHKAWEYVQADFGKDAISQRYGARIQSVLSQLNSRDKGAA